jgi:hypothetical protein
MLFASLSLAAAVQSRCHFEPRQTLLRTGLCLGVVLLPGSLFPEFQDQTSNDRGYRDCWWTIATFGGRQSLSPVLPHRFAARLREMVSGVVSGHGALRDRRPRRTGNMQQEENALRTNPPAIPPKARVRQPRPQHPLQANGIQ